MNPPTSTATKPVTKIKKIRFQNTDMLLIGGAIAFQEDYEDFRESYAHLAEDGNIYRYGEIIGTKEDIKLLEDSDLCS